MVLLHFVPRNDFGCLLRLDINTYLQNLKNYKKDFLQLVESTSCGASPLLGGRPKSWSLTARVSQGHHGVRWVQIEADQACRYKEAQGNQRWWHLQVRANL